MTGPKELVFKKKTLSDDLCGRSIPQKISTFSLPSHVSLTAVSKLPMVACRSGEATRTGIVTRRSVDSNYNRLVSLILRQRQFLPRFWVRLHVEVPSLSSGGIRCVASMMFNGDSIRVGRRRHEPCVEAMAPRRTSLFTVTPRAIVSAEVSRHVPTAPFGDRCSY